MTSYIKKYNILSNSQFGFQANKSTDLVDYVDNGLMEKSSVGAVFMDLSKAFDVISYSIFKIKLDHYGFRGSFLTFLVNF